MIDNELVKALKEVNTQAPDMLKEIEKEPEETKFVVLTMYLNEVFDKGYKLGIQKASEQNGK